MKVYTHRATEIRENKQKVKLWNHDGQGGFGNNEYLSSGHPSVMEMRQSLSSLVSMANWSSCLLIPSIFSFISFLVTREEVVDGSTATPVGRRTRVKLYYAKLCRIYRTLYTCDSATHKWIFTQAWNVPPGHLSSPISEGSWDCQPSDFLGCLST